MNALDWLSRPELSSLTWALVHFLWQGTLIAAAISLLRVRRAPVRYLILLTALAAMAVCPLVTYAVIASRSPGVSMVEAAGVEVAQSPATSVPDQSAFSLDVLRPIQPYLLVLWLTGVLTLGVRLGCGLVGTLQLKGQRMPLPLALACRVEQLGRALRLDALPRVFLSPRVGEALVVGFLRPVVLVPAAWAGEMPLEVLEAVIAHELAHIRRFDLWVNLLQRVVETLLFYHPAVWWVSRQLRQERELCCDELAVAITGRRVAYVQALELVARERLAGVRPALAAGIRGETNMKLLARVHNVLGGPTRESRSLWPAGVLALLLPLGLWAVTWGVLSPATAVAVAGDDDRDDREDREDRDDDDDERLERKEGDRERRDDDARVKKEALREFLEPKKERREEGEREEGREREREGQRGEGDEPKKERREGDAPKKERKEGDDPKKERKEGDLPKKVIKEGAAERKDPIKKGPVRKEGDAPIKKRVLAEDKGGDFGELAAMVKELRGEVERLRAEVKELRGRSAAESSREKDAKKYEDESALRNKDDLIKYRQAVERKGLEAAEAKEQAADREAIEQKERAVKERAAQERKEAEAKEREPARR